MTDQRPGQPGDQLSAPELDFGRRWRPMIDRAGGDGGQARVAKSLNWTTSTVSRDYKGDTLPTDERLLQLCHALQLPDREILDLATLLRRARAGRRDRLRASRAESRSPVSDRGQPHAAAPPHDSELPPSPGDQHTAGHPTWFHGRRRLAAVLSVAALSALAAVLLVFAISGSAPPKPAIQAKQSSGAQPVAQGIFPGLALESVQIPVRSLSPALAAQFHQGRTLSALTVTGYVFRNRGATGLCLTAVNTGAEAGKNHDPVLVGTCVRTPNQVWIPLQWEVDGFRFTHMVNDQYQSMCLNADNRGGGMRVGRIVQLWNCYPAGNEIWDFGDWHAAVSTGGRSYPLFTTSGRLCLDADKYDLRDGTPVRVWTQYAAANQFWS